MDLSLKKLLIASLMCATVLTLTPTRSNAVIGAATSNVPVVVIGGGIAGLGLYMMLSDCSDCAVSHSLGLLSFIVGVIILDDRGVVTPHFAPIAPGDASAIGLDRDEITAYNNPRNLLRLNAILNSIVVKTRKFVAETGAVPDEVDRFVAAEWKSETTNLDPDLASAREKVSREVAEAVLKN